MKKILFSLVALFLFSFTSFAQMNITDYTTMMTSFESNITTVLINECPPGMSLDQFKKNIVMGTNSLSPIAQDNLIIYAAPLLAYANQFATENHILVDNDAQRYFLSSFSPNTVIQNRKLIENTTATGLTATAMWYCTLNSFNTGTEDCPINAILNDNKDIKALTNAAASFLSTSAGVTGVLLMVNGFSNCMPKENFNKITIGDNIYIPKRDNIITKYINNQKAYDFEVSDLNINNITTTEVNDDLVIENIISHDIIRLSNLSIINDNTVTFDFFNGDDIKIGRIKLESPEAMMLPPKVWPKLIRYLTPIVKSIIEYIGDSNSDCMRAFNDCISSGREGHIRYESRDTFWGTEMICVIDCK